MVTDFTVNEGAALLVVVVELEVGFGLEVGLWDVEVVVDDWLVEDAVEVVDVDGAELVVADAVFEPVYEAEVVVAGFGLVGVLVVSCG